VQDSKEIRILKGNNVGGFGKEIRLTAAADQSASASPESAEAFWQRTLAGVPARIELQTDRPHATCRDVAIDRVSITLDSKLSHPLAVFAETQNIDLHTLALAAWALLLHRLSGQTDVVIGSGEITLPPTMPMTTSTGVPEGALPLRFEINADMSGDDLLHHTRRARSSAEAHRNFDFAGMMQTLATLDDDTDAVRIQTAVITRDPARPQEYALSAEFWSCFEIGLEMAVGNRGMEVHLHYVTARFDCQTVERHLHCWRTLLMAIAADPAACVGDLPMLDDEEKQMILQEWNATDVDYPLDLCAHHLFETQAERTPEATALVFGTRRMRYAELNANANRLAHLLRSYGVVHGDRVALILERGFTMVEAILATLKCGAAYLPIATDTPTERLSFMLDDATPVLLISDIGRPDVEVMGVPVLRIDTLAAMLTTQPEHNLGDAMPSSLPAYIIYTSGTSGAPKGVLVSHRNLVNFCFWCSDTGFTGSGVRMTQFAPYTFDASAGEIFAALLFGAELHLLDGALIQDPQRLQGYMKAQAIGFSALPPAYLQQMDPAMAPDGFHLLTAGSAPTPALAKAWASRGTYFNGYGPTETTILSTAADLSADQERITIGRPISNTRLYVLDTRMQPVPIGIGGEIWIGGAGVALGYLNQPTITAERFIDDPFAGKPGARMYRTGDLGRWLSDGTIKFIGRNDFQVKIRGFRIELGEIETALHACEGIREALVLARNDSPGEKTLVAYCRSDAPLQTDALRHHLVQSLPDYMVPSAFMRIDAWPLTENGKIDRKALPAPDMAAYRRHDYAAPVGEIEMALAAIWAETLRVEPVGRDDNFFGLGGHSLLAMSVIQAMRRQDLHAQVADIFAAENLATLARCVVRGGDHHAIPPNLIPIDATRITPQMLSLLAIDQEQIDAIAARTPGGACNIQDIYPLSPLQEGMLFHHTMSEHGDLYLLSSMLGFADRERMDALVRALQQVIDRHDVLRTGIEWEYVDVPLQVVHRSAQLVVEQAILDADGGDIAGQLKTRYTPARCRLDLRKPPLLRLYAAEDPVNGRWLLRILGHHIAMDHMGYELMLKEVRAVERGELSALPPTVPYRNFVAQTKLHTDSERDMAFFRGMLADIDEQTAPFGITETRTSDAPPDIVSRDLATAQSEVLRAHCRRLGIALSSIMHFAWALVLARTTGRSAVVFGTVVFGRMQSGDDADHALGLFINTLPCRIDLDERPLDRALKDVHAMLAQLMTHEHASLALAQRCSGIPGDGPLFSTLMNYRYSERHGPYDADSGIDLLDDFEQTNYPITVSIDDFGDDIRLVANVREGIDADVICDYLERAVLGVLAELDRPSSARSGNIDVMGQTERDRVLRQWNATDADYPRNACMHQLFEAQVARTPEAIALVHDQTRLTYHDLNQRANRLAHYLRTQGIGPDMRVGICVERSVDMMVAMLATLKAGGAYVPLDPRYPPERLGLILDDAQPRVVLTDALGAPVLVSAIAHAQRELDAVVLDLQADAELWAKALFDNPAADTVGLTSAHLGYLIYTSGSTGLPKGVAIEHRNAVNFINWAQREFTAEVLQNCLFSTSINFDLSIYETFVPLSIGGTITLVENALALLNSPLPVTLINTVPSVMTELTQADAIPSSVRVVNVAGEVLKRPLAEKILATPWVERLCNLYGPSETTTYSTWTSMDRKTGFVADIGRPVANTRIYILDTHGRPSPIGTTGEMFIGGDGVARGYLGKPEMTAERFLDDPFAFLPGARMYRTGDLARWLPDGRVEYLGRSDYQVKIRGFRIELGEIETRLATCDGIREAVVLVRDDTFGEKGLIAYYLSDTALVTDQLYEWMSATLPAHMVPSAFVWMAVWPLTPNGKLDRRALPEPELDADASRGYEAPHGPIEVSVARIWSSLLRVERVGRHDDFFKLGGHSLLAMRLVSQIRKEHGIEFTIRALFEAPILTALAERIETATASNLTAIRVIERTGPLPLSLAQQRLWLIAHIEAASTAYHMMSVLRLHGAVDAAALGRALQQVVSRHEALRTRFVLVEDEPRQEIVADCKFELDFHDLRGLVDSKQRALAMGDICFDATFDISRDLLLRALLIRLDDSLYELHIVAHHIAADGWSVGVAMQELSECYAAELAGRAPVLAELPVQYADYASWQRQWLEQGHFAQQSDYWRRTLDGAPTLLELPTDHRRPAEQTFAGDNVEVRFDPTFTAQLKALGQRHGTSLYMTLLAAWAALLSRLSNQEDVVIGSPVAGRNRSEIESLIGFFVNTLAMRIDLSGEPTVAELLSRVRCQVLDAQVHQDLPFDQVVEAINPARNTAHTPIFQVMFVLQSFDPPQLRLPGIEATDITPQFRNAKFDLTLELTERDTGIVGQLNYASALFDRETIERHVGCFLRLLRAMVDTDENHPAMSLSIIDDAQSQLLLYGWNDTVREYPRDSCLHWRFEEQVSRDPDAIALIETGLALSYAELNARANRVAHQLIAAGVKPEDRVAVCAERSAAMVVGCLGILKAGGAYVPIDPSYPRPRLEFLLGDSTPSAILAASEFVHAEWVRSAGVPVLSIDAAMADGSIEAPTIPGLGGRNAAYVIYTSGSTGTPKGVVVEHRNILRLTVNNTYAPIDTSDCIAHLANPAFDASTWEIWGALLNGARVHVIPPDAAMNPIVLNQTLIDGGVTALWMTVGLFNEYLEALAPAFSKLRYLLVGGDALDPRKIAHVLANPQRPLHLINGYGPTETTTFAVTHAIDAVPEDARSIPIGRPIANTQTYLLDRWLLPVPIGVVGELYIGGDGVARGYLNRPELSDERFVPDPFSAEHDARMYRTGDLAHWLTDGTIEFLGRSDFQVKIRGFRVELGEIEAALAACERVREAVVVVLGDSAADKRLIAYCLTLAPLEQAALRNSLAQVLPDYMVPAAFIAVDAWPLTANGKLDRRALPALQDDAFARSAYEPPQGPVEASVAALWSELLGVEKIGRHDSFFALGGHSLMAISMIERIRKLGLQTRVRALFNAPDLMGFVESLRSDQPRNTPPPDNRIPDDATVILPDMLSLVSLTQAEIDVIVAGIEGGAANIQDIYPLSSLQEGILYHRLLQEQDGGPHGQDPYIDVYQASEILSFPSIERAERFSGILQRVVDRHDILRTSFVWGHLNEPVQVVQRRAHFVREAIVIDPALGSTRDQLTAKYNSANFRIDLSKAPLFHCNYAHDSQSGRGLMCFVFHHLVMDHTTLETIIAEAVSIADGRESELPNPAPYRNYIWQAKNNTDHGAQKVFFTRTLGDIDQPTAAFGLTEMNETGADFEEAARMIPGKIASDIRRYARELGVTAAAIVHLAWGLVLARATGQDRVVFGTVLFGRMDAGEGADRALGLFINTLPIRIDLVDTGVAQTVRAVHRTLADLLHHEHASLAMAQRCSALPASTPLFTAMLNYRNSTGHDRLGDELRVESIKSGERTNYPLTIAIDDLGVDFGIGVQTMPSVGAERICDFVETALAAVIDALRTEPTMPVSAIDVLPAAEFERTVQEWNRTGRNFPLHRCAHALFEAQAENTPAAIALVFGDEQIRYDALNAKANRLARVLVEHGVAPCTMVAICLQRGIDMVVAILATLKAGGAYIPMATDAPAERIVFMLGDAKPQILLTDPGAQLPDGIGVPIVVLDEALWSRSEAQLGTDLDSDRMSSAQPAYVIYTSGTTGVPKGVVASHRNLVNFCCWCRDAGLMDVGDRMTQFAPYTFDASAGEIFAGLLNGLELHLLEDGTIQNPQRLQQYLVDRKIHFSALPPAYLQQMDPMLALPDFRLLTAGSTPTPELVRTWAGRGQYLNGYGPTETTVLSTSTALSADEDTIAIGRPIANTQVYLLDERLRPVPIGVAGEIWIGGEGVTLGYLNREELTTERYPSDPFATVVGARMYKTGDLGRWLPDGSIEFLGRNDFQVKIRGFRIELGEIESRLCEFHGVREAVVLAREDGPGGKQLVGYCLSDRAFDDAALRRHLAQSLPDYMLPAALIPMASWPLTGNGKIDRKALPPPGDDAYARHFYEAPEGETERGIAAIWSDLLGVERVGRRDNFFELGGHSLLAMQMVSRMRKTLLVELALRSLFEAPTLAALAERVDNADAALLSEIRAIDRDGPLPLSAAQKRLWFLSQIEGASAAYHMGGALRMSGALDRGALERALHRIVMRHESLRTRFIVVDSQPMQSIEPEPVLTSIFHDLDNRAEGDGREEICRRLCAEQFSLPFDLSAAPALRIQLIRLEEHTHVLHLVMHHIVSDGWSLGVMFRELSALYAVELSGDNDLLLPLLIQYADFAAWQRVWLEQGQSAKQRAFWQRTLADAPMRLELPTDRPRPLVQDFAGGSVEVHLVSALVTRLRLQAQRHGATLYMLFLASWAATLGRLANQDEVVVGSPIAGRHRAEIEPLIGFFVNTLALRIDMSGTSTVADLIAHTRHQVLDAQAHQDLPFDQVVEAVRPQRSTAHTPIFQTMLTLNNRQAGDLGMPGLEIAPIAIETEVAQFDIALDIHESEDEIAAIVNYASALFDRATAERYAAYWQRLLSAMADADDCVVALLPILDEDEHTFVIDLWNRTDAPHRQETCLHQAFEARAAQAPDAPALIGEDMPLSYRELNEHANRLAHRLIAFGVEHDDRVAICLERSNDAIIAILGVLKAGGAYVPIDPDLPAERIAYLLDDCAPKVVLTRSSIAEAFTPGTRALSLDREDLSTSPTHDPDARSRGLKPHHVAYVIYTSGSTGRPKGVLIEHASAVSRIAHAVDAYALTATDRCLQFASLSFDASVLQIFSALHAGAALLMRGRAPWSPEDVVQCIGQHRIALADVPPAYLQSLLDPQAQRAMPALRTIIVGGEATLAESLRGRVFAQTIFNEYGPTETTITATSLAVHSAEDVAPNATYLSIGRPIAETRVYILDRRLQPVPIGVIGEVHIGGIGVARGYLNRPEMTAERFLDDPYVARSDARMYKTGDLARWLPDGTIEYIGRSDFQVKIRGFRIELGEIEARLSEIDGVREAAVLAREDEPGQKRLVAYVLGNIALDIALLREQLSKQLPDYMLPASYVRMDHWPINTSGKLDRHALPAPDDQAYGHNVYEPPQGSIERAIAGVWQSLLGVGKIGRHDNFFDLGGHSLVMLQMLRTLAEQGIDIAIQDIYTLGSVQQIAATASAATADPAIWLAQHHWLHAVSERNGERVLFLASADPRAMLAFKRAMLSAAPTHHPDRIVVVEDPAMAANRHAMPSKRESRANDHGQPGKRTSVLSMARAAIARPQRAILAFRQNRAHKADRKAVLANVRQALTRTHSATRAASVHSEYDFTATHREIMSLPQRDGLHVLSIPGWWSESELRSAFAEIVRSQDMLRAVARTDSGRWHVLDPLAFRAEDVVFADLRDFSPQEADAASGAILVVLREAKAAARIGYTAAIIARGDCANVLALYGDHLLWDGQSFEGLIEAMTSAMSGRPPVPSRRYRQFSEQCAHAHEPALLLRIATELDAQGTAKAIAATTAAIAANAKMPMRVFVATVPVADGIDPAEHAFGLFLRIASQITGLKRLGIVIPHHGRQLAERTYFGEVGLFLDKAAMAVTATTTLEQAMASIKLLQRHGIRYVDWVRSGDPLVLDTLPTPEDELSFNYQLTDAAEIDPKTVDYSALNARMHALRGIACEVYGASAQIQMLFAYRGRNEQVAGVNKIVESASGSLIEVGTNAHAFRSQRSQ
jgi:amino acid adenylation domain-containing protein